MAHVDVGAGALKTTVSSRDYQMGDVTGSSVTLQAVMVAQVNAAKAVREAVVCIEGRDLPEFAFVCDGGTHRSTSCAVLLAMLAYYGAGVCFHTPRTVNDLRDAIDAHMGRR